MADVDVVSPSNLQRQVLFGVSTLGEDKVAAAAKRLKDLERENARLRRLVADLSLEKQVLTDVASGNL